MNNHDVCVVHTNTHTHAYHGPRTHIRSLYFAKWSTCAADFRLGSVV